MQSNYPVGISGNPTLEDIYDMGFTKSFTDMAQIFDLIKNTTSDPVQIINRLNAFFAVGMVKTTGGTSSEMALAAMIYGDESLANSLMEE